MSITNKVLKKELGIANRKLGTANNIIFKQMQVINAIQAERDELR